MTRGLEKARKDKIIGHPLDAVVVLTADGDLYDFLAGFASELRRVFIVSGVELERGNAPDAENGLGVSVKASPAVKCPRCWVRDESVPRDDSGQPAGVCGRCGQALEA